MNKILRKILAKFAFFYKEEKNRRKIARLNGKAKGFDFTEKPKIVFWMAGGMELLTEFESTIALSLKLRGADVHAVLCDGSLRGCIRREASDNQPANLWGKACVDCKKNNEAILRRFGIPFSYVGDFLESEDKEEIRKKCENISWSNLQIKFADNLRLINNVRSSIARYLKGKDLNGYEEIVPLYLFSALVVHKASKSLLRQLRPFRVFMSHAVYVDWGPVLNNSLAIQVPIISYVSGYLPSRFFFKKICDMGFITPHGINDSVWESKISQKELSMEEEIALNRFFENRYKNNLCSDMRDFNTYLFDKENDVFKKFQGIENGKPIWAIMCHINWDNVFDYTESIYSNFNEWIVETIKVIIHITDVVWLIKIHPAEKYDNPETGIQKLIESQFSLLPNHIKLVAPDCNINPLNFYEMISGIITVCGTAGLEVANFGKPVVLAGKAHYSGKGFTYDVDNPETYKEILRKASSLPFLSDEQVKLARLYSYYYFLRRQIPIPLFKEKNSKLFKFQIDQINFMLPGFDPFYDFICDEILYGGDFIMSDDLVKLAQSHY